MKLGIMSGVYGKYPLNEAARKIKEAGFEGVQLDLPFELKFTPAELVEILRLRYELEVAALSGYKNLVDPHEARRRDALKQLRLLIKSCHAFGTQVVVTGTGSRNPDNLWGAHPDNAKEETWQLLRETVAELVKLAEDSGVTIAIECYVNCVVSSVEKAERLLSEINSPHLKILMDPCNFFDAQSIDRVPETLEHIFARLGSHIALAHAKDVTRDLKLPAAGQGVLDYATFIRLMKQHAPDSFLIIEHLTEEQVPQVKAYVERFL